jgi:hypothetical protein
MEDFLMSTPLAPEHDAPRPQRPQPCALKTDPASSLAPAPTPSFAELRVLAAGAALGVRANANAGPGLSQVERRRRIEALLALWQTGCRSVIDEALYTDLAARHPELAALVRARLRRRARGSRAHG